MILREEGNWPQRQGGTLCKEGETLEVKKIARGKLIFQKDGWRQLVKKARRAGTPEKGEKANLPSEKP
jgi:hypothetical protein